MLAPGARAGPVKILRALVQTARPYISSGFEKGVGEIIVGWETLSYGRGEPSSTVSRIPRASEQHDMEAARTADYKNPAVAASRVWQGKIFQSD